MQVLWMSLGIGLLACALYAAGLRVLARRARRPEGRVGVRCSRGMPVEANLCGQNACADCAFARRE